MRAHFVLLESGRPDGILLLFLGLFRLGLHWFVLDLLVRCETMPTVGCDSFFRSGDGAERDAGRAAADGLALRSVVGRVAPDDRVRHSLRTPMGCKLRARLMRLQWCSSLMVCSRLHPVVAVFTGIRLGSLWFYSIGVGFPSISLGFHSYGSEFYPSFTHFTLI